MTAPLAVGFGNRFVGPTQPVLVVAEISGNHEGRLSQAIDLIRAAKWAGADAVKFQCSEPSDLIGEDRLLDRGPGAGRRLSDLSSRAQTPPRWFPALFAEARHNGLIAFASVFHQRHLPMLAECGSAAYKIASPEITALDLIRACAGMGKPVVVSTGMASPEEIAAAASAAGHNAILLHCVSAYPTSLAETHLREMLDLPCERRGGSDPAAINDARVIGVCPTAPAAHLPQRHLI